MEWVGGQVEEDGMCIFESCKAPTSHDEVMWRMINILMTQDLVAGASAAQLGIPRGGFHFPPF